MTEQRKEMVLPTPETRFKTLTELLSDLSSEDLGILDKRARDLSHQAIETEDHTGDIVSVLTFNMNGESYAIRAEQIRHIGAYENMTYVPFVPNFVVGVINLQGNILSLINIAKFLDIPETDNIKPTHYIVVEAHDFQIGILVKHLGEIKQFPTKAFTRPPENVNTIQAEFIEGVSSDGLILLDIPTLMDNPGMVINQESHLLN